MLKALVRIRKLLHEATLFWPTLTQALKSDIVSGSSQLTNSTMQYGVARADKFDSLRQFLRHPWSAEQWHTLGRFLLHYEVVDHVTLRECEEIAQQLVGMTGPRTPSQVPQQIPRSHGDRSSQSAAATVVTCGRPAEGR